MADIIVTNAEARERLSAYMEGDNFSAQRCLLDIITMAHNSGVGLEELQSLLDHLWLSSTWEGAPRQ